ncbi:MAG TPA: GGDEF domain-containing protein [Thermoleophilaceae bacterium]|nr:GGDEF domain-containing protein [Thermoleophilaceae bacterium]
MNDELTGLADLRELHAVLDREIERSRRLERPLGLVMLDLDDFRWVNDGHGHRKGDEVLVAVARAVREVAAGVGVPARYGGEQLVVVVPETGCEGAAHLAERMRRAVESLRIEGGERLGSLRVTASFGAAAISTSGGDKESLIAAADAALYRAKRAGKNRVERAGAAPVSA